jgi:dienelactone hydrolase
LLPLEEVGCCCPPSAWPKLDADEGRALNGALTDLGSGLKGYVSVPKVPSGRAVIVVYDVYGLAGGGRLRTVCDTLAEEGFLALMPDLYGNGDSIDNHGGVSNIGSEETMGWIRSHAWGDLHAKLQITAAYAASHGVQTAPSDDNRVAIVGFCWGAWVAAKASATGLVRAAVHMHPSWQIAPWIFHEPILDVAARIRAPSLIMPAGDDPAEYRNGVYKAVIESNSGCPVSTVDFRRQRHGFVARGDPKDLLVMAAVNRAIIEMVAFLKAHVPEA